MAKLRLTAEIRQALHNKAREFIRLPVLEDAERRERERVYSYLDTYIFKKYPVADMDLLEKYKVAMKYPVGYGDCVLLADGRRAEFPYGVNTLASKADNAPGLVYYTSPRIPKRDGRGYYCFDMQNTKGFQAVWDTWNAPVDAYVAEYRKIKIEYTKLIDNARTLEEIESVWPEASTVREFSKRNLPALVLDSTISAIQRHRELMAAQTKKTKRKANPEG